MIYDYSKLCNAICTTYKTQAVFAKKMSISEHSISLKLNNKLNWKQSEIIKACEVLSISFEKIPEYFFAPQVQNFEQIS